MLGGDVVGRTGVYMVGWLGGVVLFGLIQVLSCVRVWLSSLLRLGCEKSGSHLQSPASYLFTD